MITINLTNMTTTTMEGNKNYREITFNPGSNIESAINELSRYKDKNELVFGVFNDKKLYSDVDDLDSAYKKITGKTKSEFDEIENKRHQEYLEKERKHKHAIPELTKKWIEEGKKVLDEKYLKKWTEIVPIRLSDLYHGMELNACLEIVKKLNAGCKLSVAKNIIDKQGHSGMSFTLVCSMVIAFCDRGQEFVSYIKLNR